MLIACLRNGCRQPWLMLMVLLSISGCAPMPEKVVENDVRLTLAQYSQMAHAQLAQGQVHEAAVTIDKMELSYPLHAETSKLQLRLVEGYYEAGYMDHAVAAAGRFITMFPGYKDVDYAYYLRGLANFARGITSMSQMSDNPDSDYAEESLASFTALLERFPRSQYAANAQHYASYLQSQLQGYRYRVLGYTPLRPMASSVQMAPARSPVVAAAEKSDVKVAALEQAQAPGLAEPTAPLPVAVVAAPVAAKAEIAAAPAVQADERFHTIQVAAFPDLESLKNQIARLGLVGEVGYYARDVKGKQVYAALYGRYPTAATARAMMVALQARTGLKELWLRQRFSFEAEVTAPASR